MILKLNKIRYAILWALSFSASISHASEFNIDVLDAEDIKNVDMSQFAVAGYVLPGNYVLSVFVNGQRLGAPRDITVFEAPKDSKEESQFICLPAEMLNQLGLTESAQNKVILVREGKCLDLSPLAGTKIKVDLATLSAKVTIPQTWMEYQDPYWVTPNLWEDGINGAFVDYNANASVTSYNSGENRSYLSTNGIAGINLGAWRVRGDYSASHQNKSANSNANSRFDFNRLYAFTSLKKLASVLTVGENYFYSNIFESWQYTGMSLESDERMLPPKLVGYAPEVIGVADTNATVIIRNQDRVILETTVPPGPFRIQSLDSGVRGTLDVTVREENGTEKKFSINTASLPYLTRPGRVNYKFATGKTRYDSHHVTGKPVVSGELSYGVSNAWSIYGGTQANTDYQSIAVGVGRDLFAFGALSIDVTQSIARFSNQKLQGRSYRLNYSKSFNELRTDITFAGYRFADETYRTITQYMTESRTGIKSIAPKENYQIYLNKYFDDFNLSFNYQYSTYWQQKPETQYGLYASTNIKIPGLSQQDVSVSVSATRTQQDTGHQDDAINLYLTIPFRQGHSVTMSESYSRSKEQKQYNHNIGYNGYNENDNYSINVGYNHGKYMDDQASLSGYYSHEMSLASVSANASYVPDQYKSVGVSMNSGLTITSHGASLHRSANGDTRLVIETPNVSGVPLDNGVTKTNAFGLAVLPNISSYRKSTATINTSKLPDNMESLDSSTDITLTKGAIGYRTLSVMTGEKLFAILSLDNNKTPPFGASVRNASNRELGIVGEDGVTWLVGLSPQEKLSVYWNGEKQCELVLPEKLTEQSNMLLLPCKLANPTSSELKKEKNN